MLGQKLVNFFRCFFGWIENTTISLWHFLTFKGYSDRTPLHLAAVSGHPEVIKYYYKILPDIGIFDSSGKNVLHLAVYAKQLVVVEFLADLIDIDIKTNGFRIETALDIAYKRGHEG